MKEQARRCDGELKPEAAAVACEVAWGCVRNMLDRAIVIPVGQAEILQAFTYKRIHDDLEDDIVLGAAYRAGIDYIVTHDKLMWLAIFGHGLRFRPNPPTMGREASRPGERGIESVEVDEEDVQPGVQDGRGAGRREGRQDAVAGGQRPRRGAVAGVRVARPAGRVRRRRVRQGPVGAREEAGGGGRAEGA